MIRIRTMLFLTMIFVSSVLASEPAMTKTGTTAASFLKIGSSARALGMGGAFVGVSDDVSAIFWNPAGLARMKNGEAIFNHVNWIADVKYDVAAASLVFQDVGTMAVSVGILSMGDMEITTTGQPEGTGSTFSAGGNVVGLSFARNLTDMFSIGFTGKYIREYIYNESASSFALDLGTWYRAPILNGVCIGASLLNFGPKMSLEGRDVMYLHKVNDLPNITNVVNSSLEMDEFDLPLSFRVGIATDAIRDDNSRLTLAVDAVHPNDNTEYVNSGMEYCWQNTLSARLGWKSAFELDGEQGFTAGVGIAYDLTPTLGFLFDYAYQDFGRLKEVHYFSVGVKF